MRISSRKCAPAAIVVKLRGHGKRRCVDIDGTDGAMEGVRRTSYEAAYEADPEEETADGDFGFGLGVEFMATPEVLEEFRSHGVSPRKVVPVWTSEERLRTRFCEAEGVDRELDELDLDDFLSDFEDVKFLDPRDPLHSLQTVTPCVRTDAPLRPTRYDARPTAGRKRGRPRKNRRRVDDHATTTTQASMSSMSSTSSTSSTSSPLAVYSPHELLPTRITPALLSGERAMDESLARIVRAYDAIVRRRYSAPPMKGLVPFQELARNSANYQGLLRVTLFPSRPEQGLVFCRHATTH